MNRADLGWDLFAHNPKLHGQALLVLRISLLSFLSVHLTATSSLKLTTPSGNRSLLLHLH